MKRQLVQYLADLKEKRIPIKAKRDAIDQELAVIDDAIRKGEAFLMTLPDEAGETPARVTLSTGVVFYGGGEAIPYKASDGMTHDTAKYGANIKAVRALLQSIRLTTFNVRDIVAGLKVADVELDEYQVGQVLRKMAGKEIIVEQEGAGRRPTEYKLNPEYKLPSEGMYNTPENQPHA